MPGPHPNPPRRPPGLPGVAAHERTPTERTATQEMIRLQRELQQRQGYDPHRMAEMYAIDPSLFTPVIPPPHMRSTPSLIARDDLLRIRQPIIVDDIVSESAKLDQPKAVIAHAVEKAARHFGSGKHLLCANEERDLMHTLHWGRSSKQHQEMVEYTAKEMKRRIEARVGHDITEKCGVQYEHDYNRLRASCEMVLFTRKEFDNFIEDLTANVIAAVKQKGYIK
jgi:hypothetical protein